MRVVAAGVNRPDVAQRQGHYPPPPGAPDIPGLEVAGTVAGVGPGVTRWKTGDAVTALVPGGATPNIASSTRRWPLPVPAGMSLKDAACLPETYFTVWTNVLSAAP